MPYKLIAGVGVILIVAFFSYRAGVDHEQAKDAKALIEYQKKVASLVDELEESKKKRKVVIRNKIVRIKDANSQCADTVIDKPILDQLR